jgi:hypothetical protein
VYLDPKVHVLLHEIDLDPREGVARGIDKPVIENNFTGSKERQCSVRDRGEVIKYHIGFGQTWVKL